jgi:hypothetical protein
MANPSVSSQCDLRLYEGWYNRARLESTLNYSTPNAYEENDHRLTAAA